MVLYDKAGEEILRRSMAAVQFRILPPSEGIVVYKNNSDGKGNSYGTHENYLMDRAVPFAQIAQGITPHFVTRQVYTGAGKVGRGDPYRRARRAVPALAACGVLRGGGRSRDHAQAAHRERA